VATPPAALIIPIACDLAYNQSNDVVCGHNTARALQDALQASYEYGNAPIFLSATFAGIKWGYVNMASVMQKFLVQQRVSPELHRLHVIRCEAPYFSTLGELIALANYLKRIAANPSTKVVFTVSDWHHTRLRKLVDGVFAWKDIQVEIEVRTYPGKSTFWERILEPIKIRKNLLHINSLQSA
jgi:hypothetical protein